MESLKIADAVDVPGLSDVPIVPATRDQVRSISIPAHEPRGFFAMMIKRRSTLTGIERTVDLPIVPEQIRFHAAGVSPLEAFPNLTSDQREFFLTGITAQEWDEACDDEEILVD